MCRFLFHGFGRSDICLYPHLGLLVLSLLGGVSIDSKAQDASGLPFATEIKRELEMSSPVPLPRIEDILPGFQESTQMAPSLVVGDLETKSNDALEWGRAIGAILRWKTTFCPSVVLRAPSLHPDLFKSDAWRPGISEDEVGRTVASLRLFYDRMGIEHGVMGSVEVGDTTVVLSLDLISFRTMEKVKQFNHQGSLNELPDLLSGAALRILETIKVSLKEEERSYLGRRTPEKAEEIRSFAMVLSRLDSLSAEEKLDQWMRLWETETRLPAMVPYYCSSLHDHRQTIGEDWALRLAGIRERFNDDAGVLFCVSEYLGSSKDDDFQMRSREGLKKFARENPKATMALSTLGHRYLSLEPYSAIVLAVEAARRFPRNFRNWWSLMYILREASEDIQATASYDSVDRRLFQFLMMLDQYSGLALEKALMFNSNNPHLWRQKMLRIAGTEGFNEKYMAAFERAVESGPKITGTYEMARRQLLLSGGGNIDYVIRILKAAMANIPDQRGKYIPLFEDAINNLTKLEIADAVDNQSLVGYARDLFEPAHYLGIERNSLDKWGLCLGVFRRNGATSDARQLLRRAFDQMKADRGRADDGFFYLTDFALAFQEPLVLEQSLELWPLNDRPDLPIDNQRIVGGIKTLVPLFQGDYVRSKALLEEGITQNPEDRLLKLLYLELGFHGSLDPGLESECIDELVSFAPEPLDYGPFEGQGPRFYEEEQLPFFFDDYLRASAQGHLSSRRGEWAKAIQHYVQAGKAVRASRRVGTIQVHLPSVDHHLWTARRNAAGAPPAN